MFLLVTLAAALVVGLMLFAVSPLSSPGILSAEVRPERLALSGSPGIDAYRGLGTWIDVDDYAPGDQPGRRPAPLSPSAVRTIAATGARTLFLQTAVAPTDGPLKEPALLGRFLAAAHGAGLRVVGWYVPTFTDVEADLERLVAVTEFGAGGHRFDGLAVEIEATQAVGDPATATGRLLELSRRLREAVGPDYPLAAIVPPPVLLDDLNPELWPAFPWAQLHKLYDVWIPMSYWTLPNPSPDPGRYTTENVERLRRALGDPDAPVHILGGVGDQAGENDYLAFVQAVQGAGALGFSVYDYRSTSAGGLAVLRHAGGGSGSPTTEEDLRE